MLSLCWRGRRPSAEDNVRAQDQQIPEHLKRVGDNVQFASRDLVPFDWNLGNRNMQLLCEQEKLDVEDPGGQMLVRKDELGGATSKELESTLSIANVTDAHDTQNRM